MACSSRKASSVETNRLPTNWLNGAWASDWNSGVTTHRKASSG